METIPTITVDMSLALLKRKVMSLEKKGQLLIRVIGGGRLSGWVSYDSRVEQKEVVWDQVYTGVLLSHSSKPGSSL